MTGAGGVHVFCEGCGAAVTLGSAFCSACGRALEKGLAPRPPAIGEGINGPILLHGSPKAGERIELGNGEAKLRSFWKGFILSVVSLGIYHYFWWYRINDELKEIGVYRDDRSLAESSPTNSVVAILIGWVLVVPPLISIYNTAMRIRRAERLGGVDPGTAINPTLALLLAFPGGLLIVPLFAHYAYMTRHQNVALLSAAGLPSDSVEELSDGARGVASAAIFALIVFVFLVLTTKGQNRVGVSLTFAGIAFVISLAAAAIAYAIASRRRSASSEQ